MTYRRKPSPASEHVEAMELTVDNFREVHEFLGLETTPTWSDRESPDSMLLGMHVGWFATVNRDGQYVGYPPDRFHEMYEPVEQELECG